MNKKYLCIFLLFISFKSFSQDIDTEQLLHELLGDSAKATSNFKVSTAFGNRLFSVKNNTLNADQSENRLVIIPAIGYCHKSGVSLTFSGYAFNDNSRFKFYQFAVTPAYELDAKNFATSVSFTRYFQSNVNSSAASPIQNDLYANAVYKKKWLQPGIALGYANGKYSQITPVDTTVKVGNQFVHFKFKDTANVKVSSFSLSGSVQHEFGKEGLITKSDEFIFNPQLLINFGSGTYSESHNTSGNAALVKNSPRRGKNFSKSGSSADNTSFQLESLALNIDMAYGIGKFSIEPNIYLDYYLPLTDSKRFSQVYAVNFIYRF